MVEYFLRLSFLQCIMQIGNFSLLLPPSPPPPPYSRSFYHPNVKIKLIEIFPQVTVSTYFPHVSSSLLISIFHISL